MLNFIPATILFQLTQDPSSVNRELPLTYSSTSVVLTAELRFFYDQHNLRDSQFPDEQRLNEHLSTISHQFLEMASSTLSKYGGDLIQYLGRAFIAIFPDGEPREVCRRAVACATEMIKESQYFLDNKISNNQNITTLCIGLGYGQIQVLHVGGILNRVEFFVSGEAQIRALKALRLTDLGEKRICLSGEMEPMIRDDFYESKMDQIKQATTCLSPNRPLSSLEEPSAEDLNYFFITKAKQNIRPERNILLQKVKTNEDIIKMIQLQLKSYIPGSYRHLSQLKSKDSKFGSHSKQTVVAVAFEFHTNHKKSKEQHSDLKLLQSFIQVVQAQVYKMEGSITKILAYESGIIVIATWGMQFLCHVDDCSRAVFAAINIKKHLTKLQLDSELQDDSFVEPPVHIGVATGDVFQGVVGNLSCREIVSVGEATERAILLLQAAQSNYSKIYVDQTTKQFASHSMDFDYIEHLEISSKQINTAIYSPSQPSLQQASLQKDKKQAAKQAQEIRILANPFFIDRDNFYLKNFSEAYGRQTTLSSVMLDIQDYLHNESSSAWVLAVKGPFGSGKSLFARKVLIELAQAEKTMLKPLHVQHPQLHFEFLVCNNDADQNMLFLGVWRQFMKHLLALYSQSIGQSQEYVINAQLQHTVAIEDKVHIIANLFSLPLLSKTSSSADPYCIGAEAYSEECEDILLFFCFDFISHALSQLRDKVFYLVVIDNAESLNYNSWRLFDLIQSQCNRIALVMNIESATNYFEEMPNESISQLGFKIDANMQTQQYYKEFLKAREFEIFAVAEMTPLTKESIIKSFKELGPVYERTINREIEDLTRIKNQKGSNKTYADQKELTLYLISNYLAYQKFEDIQPEIVDYVLQQVEGYPLQVFWFTFQLVIQGYLAVENHTLSVGAKFNSTGHQKSWINIQLPYLLMKKMNVALEHAIKLQSSRVPKLSSAMSVQLVSILYSASVVGEVFSQNLLDASNKVVVQSDKQVSTAEILREAEERDLVELVSIDEVSGDIIYRFTNKLLRIAMYQMQPWETQKRETHFNTIKYLIDRIVLDYTNSWSHEQEYAYFLRHVLRFESVLNEDQLSAESRQKLVIKRINQLLNRRLEIIKSGTLKLLTDGKPEDVVVELKKSQWLEIKKKQGVQRIELASIKKVIKIEPLASTLQETEINLSDPIFQFKIIWSLDYELKSEVLVLQQAAANKKANREAEDWMTAIEFLRTKETFDRFATQYGNFYFNLDVGNQQNVEKVDHHVFHLSKQLLSRLPSNKPRLKSISISKDEGLYFINPKKQKQSHFNASQLISKIKALYQVSALQFLKHIQQPDKRLLGDVCPQLQQPFQEQCRNVMGDQQLSVIQSDDDLKSLLSIDNTPTVPQQITQQEEYFLEKSVWEDRDVPRLNCMNALWREGPVVASAIQSRQADTQGEFKLQRRRDCLGYNKQLSPYRTAHFNSPKSQMTSIQEMQSELKSPQKNRKPKAEAIQKILENQNSQWYTTYISAVKQRTIRERPETPRQQEQTQIALPSPTSDQPKQYGGLVESKSHISIGQSLQEQDLNVTPLKRKLTFRSVKQESRNIQGDSLPSKKGDNIYARLPTEQTESEASFSDYDYRVQLTPAKSSEIGAPVKLVQSKPQYLIVQQDVSLKLKQNDIVYLSEAVTDNPIIKCHTWVDGERIDLMLGQHQIMRIRDSHKVLNGQQDQEPSSTIKKIATQGTLLNHNDSSLYELQKPIASFMKRSESKQQINPKNMMFVKLQARIEAKLNRQEIVKAQTQNQLLDSPQHTPSPGQETTPLNSSPFSVGQGIVPFASHKKPLKATERIRKRLLQQLP